MPDGRPLVWAVLNYTAITISIHHDHLIWTFLLHKHIPICITYAYAARIYIKKRVMARTTCRLRKAVEASQYMNVLDVVHFMPPLQYFYIPHPLNFEVTWIQNTHRSSSLIIIRDSAMKRISENLLRYAEKLATR